MHTCINEFMLTVSHTVYFNIMLALGQNVWHDVKFKGNLLDGAKRCLLVALGKLQFGL